VFEAHRVQQWLDKIPEGTKKLSEISGFVLRREDLERVIADSINLAEIEKRIIPEFEYSIAIPFLYRETDTHYTVPDWDLAHVEDRLEKYKKDFPGAYIVTRFSAGTWTRLVPEPREEYDPYDE
jgi:hypothetical protein